MDNLQKTKKLQQFEKLYTAVLLLIVAILMLASILYTTQLWLVKIFIVVILLGISVFFGRKYFQDK
ncbi:MAG: hypothetical protein L0Y56_17990 [Nitrospira sp.]|nr:hypothetical protein [Nitrospira sp.]